LGFRALGLLTVTAETPEEGREALHRLAREGSAIIYITEQLAQRIPDAIARYQDHMTPAIILIPGKSGSTGIGLTALRSSVERAVGADILSDKPS